MKSLSSQLRTFRKEANLTQEELADRSGVSLSTIRNIEQGSDTNTATLRKLYDVLGFVFNIYNWKNDETDKP